MQQKCKPMSYVYCWVDLALRSQWWLVSTRRSRLKMTKGNRSSRDKGTANTLTSRSFAECPHKGSSFSNRNDLFYQLSAFGHPVPGSHDWDSTRWAGKIWHLPRHRGTMVMQKTATTFDHLTRGEIFSG